MNTLTGSSYVLQASMRFAWKVTMYSRCFIFTKIEINVSISYFRSDMLCFVNTIIMKYDNKFNEYKCMLNIIIIL